MWQWSVCLCPLPTQPKALWGDLILVRGRSPSSLGALIQEACLFFSVSYKVMYISQGKVMIRFTSMFSEVQLIYFPKLTCFLYFYPYEYYFHRTYWPDLDGKIREALVLRSVKVRLLISFWKETDPLTFNFISSLKAICTEIANCSLKVVSTMLTWLLMKMSFFPLHTRESYKHTHTLPIKTGITVFDSERYCKRQGRQFLKTIMAPKKETRTQVSWYPRESSPPCTHFLLGPFHFL